MSSGGGEVSIPSNMKKMIQNIKEISGNHSDDEIYIMLKECNMDPNETAQKLLFQDTFHEVKRKRDRKKENVNKESTESRWKPGTQGRGSRAGRGNYSSRHGSHDAGGTRNAAPGKDNGPSDGISMPPTSKDMKHKVTYVVSSTTVTTDGFSVIASDSTGAIQAGSQFIGVGNNQSITSAADISKTECPSPFNLPAEAGKTSTIAFVNAEAPKQLLQFSGNIPTSRTSASSSGVYSSASDPVLVSSQDTRLLGAVGTIKREVVSQHITSEQILVVPVESQLTAVVPIKEWQPKPTNFNLAPQVSGTVVLAQVPAVSVETAKAEPATGVLDSKLTYLKLENQLKESHISDSQHVIIPNHLHVQEVEKLGFCFGSFDANFGLDTNYYGAENNKKSLSETTEKIEERCKEQPSNINAMANAEDGDGPEHAPSSSQVSRSLTANDSDFSSALVVSEYCESKQETDLPSGGNQYSSVNTSPTYSFGVMPTMVASQVAQAESTESQARDDSRLPSFVVQQPFDPNSYYAQLYRSGADTDTRTSSFHSPGFTTKYNGNVAILSPQASQSSQEVSNSLILSTAGPTPLVTQAAGVMQSSIAVTQQPLPVFRQPAGVHLPHYPTNYIPYGHYYSPFFVPPPAIHQFFSNGAFPPQPQPGSLYPTPPVATTKYPLSQYKTGNNAGNSTQMGAPGSYGPYASSPAGFNTSSATTGNSTSSEDLVSPHIKENNVYITGQQSEGSGVWFAPGREISGLQPSSFYNLPQAQMAFTATQAGHGSFPSIYHPAQPGTAAAVHPLLQPSQAMAGAVDMAGPTASVYQPSQPTAINWPNNY